MAKPIMLKLMFHFNDEESKRSINPEIKEFRKLLEKQKEYKYD